MLMFGRIFLRVPAHVEMMGLIGAGNNPMDWNDCCCCSSDRGISEKKENSKKRRKIAGFEEYKDV